MTPFAWTGGSITVTLTEQEASLLGRIPRLLAAVGGEAGDAASARLNPAAYRDDEEADGEYRRLMAGELDVARAGDRGTFIDTVRSGTFQITLSEGEAWLRVLGDARLALAARQGVVDGEDEWEHRIGVEPDLALVAWLGHLQANLVDALGEALG